LKIIQERGGGFHVYWFHFRSDNCMRASSVDI
jgi:hypothetical protein